MSIVALELVESRASQPCRETEPQSKRRRGHAERPSSIKRKYPSMQSARVEPPCPSFALGLVQSRAIQCSARDQARRVEELPDSQSPSRHIIRSEQETTRPWRGSPSHPQKRRTSRKREEPKPEKPGWCDATLTMPTRDDSWTVSRSNFMVWLCFRWRDAAGEDVEEETKSRGRDGEC